MNTVRINTYRDGSRAITYDADRLFAVNSGLLGEEGKTLEDFATEEPTAIYDYLRREIGESATHHALDVSVDNQLLAASILDGQETVREVAAATMLSYLPSPFEGPFEVSIRLGTETETSEGILATSVELFRLHVQPPSLA